MDISIQLAQEERDLIQACLAKERWAQKKLYEEFYGILMSICLRYANNSDDALDILHEGYIKIFRHLGKYKPGTSLSAWMRRIMVNTSIDYYRKESRRRTENLDQAYGINAKTVSPVSMLAAEEILMNIQKLSPAYRSVFNLYVIDGFSHREISKQLNITESTSRSNLVKARIKLRDLLSAYSDEYKR